MIHSQRLERFYGAERLAALAKNMRGWYGPPIVVAMPGKGNRVKITKDGDFEGKLADGFFSGMNDVFEERGKRILRKLESIAAGGFTTVPALLTSNAIAMKGRQYPFVKATTGATTQVASSTWRQGNLPAAAGAPSNAPGGDALTAASAGAININYDTCISGDFELFLSAIMNVSATNFGLLLYDRLFQVNKTMASTATEAVTGVPTRYTNTTRGSADSAVGNFIGVEVQTVLPATAHNWTVTQYTDQDGNATQSAPSMTGISTAAVNSLDHPVGQWFMPLAAGDDGLTALSQMQCSASLASGAIAFFIGHPLAFLPVPLTSVPQRVGAINFNIGLARIFDNACLALLEMPKNAATGITWDGFINTVRG